MTPREALDRITAICDDTSAPGTSRLIAVVELRQIIAEVSPEPGGDMQRPLADHGDMQSSGRGSYKSGGTLDRDQARPIINQIVDDPDDVDPALDALARCVRPAAIDRDALIRHIRETVWDDYEASASAEEVADGILALVRPVAGVTLTPEEAALALDWYADAAAYRQRPADEALAARLEAGS